MTLIRNTRAISRLSLIVLLLVAFVLGVVLSYIWTMSYYAPKEFQLPSNSTVTIESVQFYPQDASRFNVTILNPSFSPSSVDINRIAVLTAEEVIHDPSEVSPSLPRPLALGESQTFDCDWDWTQYTGQAISVLAWLEDGSGATLEVETPFVGLVISELEFDSSISVTRFNVTVQNLESSATHVNVTSISLDSILISPDDVVPSLPYAIAKGESVKFTCPFNWTDYQGESVTVVVKTLQGYWVERAETTPQPVVLAITEAVFNVTYTDHFNITIQNAATSPSNVTTTRILVVVEGEPTYTVEETVPSLPQPLPKNSTIHLKCYWNWEDAKGKTVTIMALTSQGFTASYPKELPT